MRMVPEKPIHLPGGSIPRNTFQPVVDSIVPRRLIFRANPPTPDEESLLALIDLQKIMPLGGNYDRKALIAGLSAVWRHGCDAGMVAP